LSASIFRTDFISHKPSNSAEREGVKYINMAQNRQLLVKRMEKMDEALRSHTERVNKPMNYEKLVEYGRS
jgi:hypothetical protein